MRHLSVRTWLLIALTAVLTASFVASISFVVADAATSTVALRAGDSVTVTCPGVMTTRRLNGALTVKCPAAPSPSDSVSVSVSASGTPTVVPTPSSTPSPTPTGFPDASNTGVPSGTVLRTVANGDSGPCWNVERDTFYVTCSTTLDALNIPMVLKVMANNVAVTKSHITAASYYTINTCDCPTYYSGLSLIDDDIDGASDAASQSIAVMGNADATYLRDHFHGMASSGPRLDSGDLLQDSLIDGFVCKQPDHSAGTSANDGGTNIQVLHNTIDINTTAAGCATAALELAQDFGRYDNVTIAKNLLAGGAYCLYAAQNVPNNSYGQSINIRVTDNVFSKKYSPMCGLYGPAAEVSSGNGNTFTGNTYDDGTPIN